MRYVDLSLIDPNDPDVKDWVKRAYRRKRTLTGKATHKERVDYLKRANIWREFKPVLEKYYGKKCWYSECDLTGSFGDVDHFRPKSKSTNMDGTVILEEGYWWLAYDYTNYRLSCEVCNRSYEKGGKNDRFPLKDGTIPAQVPLKNDTPVLLDPCNKEDTELIDCDESGKIIPLSKDEYKVFRVRVSTDIYNWNYFNTARKKIRTTCKTTLELFEMIYDSKPEKMALCLKTLRELTAQESPYSSFARRYIELKISGKPFESVIKQLL